MYYISNGGVYVRDGDVYRNISISAKDKEIIVKERESITINMESTTTKNLDDLQTYTLEEVLNKFNVSEENPIKPVATLRTKSKEK